MNIVKQLREKAGMQQKELAMLVGITQPTISEWEHQKKDPSGERLKKLCEIFHTTPWVILCIMPPEKGDIFDDDDTMRIRERLRTDPNYRMLFDAAENATPEHLRAAVAMLNALKGSKDD